MSVSHFRAGFRPEGGFEDRKPVHRPRLLPGHRGNGQAGVGLGPRRQRGSFVYFLLVLVLVAVFIADVLFFVIKFFSIYYFIGLENCNVKLNN